MTEETGATAELEAVPAIEKEVIEQPKSMDDTIRETLRGLQDKGTAADKETPATPESPEEKAQRIRDSSGKFAKEAAPAEVAPEAAPAAPEYVPPNTWKKEAAEKLRAADPAIRAEVERREADFHKGIEQYRGKAQFAESIERAITPYAETLRSLNITPDKAIGELMQADHILRHGAPHEKTAYFAQLARNYGIDMGAVAQQPEQAQIDPNVNFLTQQVRELREFQQNQILTSQQREQDALNSEISAFAADPKHSHFESVKGHMSALLQAGQAKDLADAYEQAVYANPTTRAAILAQQQADARAEATKKAQAAKTAASVNVRSRPSMPVSQPIGSMDETIRATLRKLQNA